MAIEARSLPDLRDQIEAYHIEAERVMREIDLTIQKVKQESIDLANDREARSKTIAAQIRQNEKDLALMDRTLDEMALKMRELRTFIASQPRGEDLATKHDIKRLRDVSWRLANEEAFHMHLLEKPYIRTATSYQSRPVSYDNRITMLVLPRLGLGREFDETLNNIACLGTPDSGCINLRKK
jgi:hypothetical protein